MPGEIFEWESITQPSYYKQQILAETGQKAMMQIVATGANTVTIIPNFFQADKFSNSVFLKLDQQNPWGSESDTYDEVKAAVLSAKARGLKVVLKPHVETTPIRVWRAEFEPTDPVAWFASYKAMMVEYAKVAQAAGAEMFCVGTEMVSMTDPTKVCSDGMTYTEKWEDIIDAVRAVYSGKVTYSATYEEVTKVGFWHKVDYIGVNPYIPLSTINDPTVGQMVDAWVKPHFNPWIRDTLYQGKSVIDYYKSLSEQYGKKVIFTEVGYKSLDGANKDPGLFGSTGEVDFQEQVDAYTALFHVMENYGGRWLAGSFMWSYYSFENPMEERGVPWTDYTTQWKPANLTITEHYSGPAHVRGLVWNGTGGADKLDGGYHNDTLNGAGGNDVLWGGAGHDVISGGVGADVMTGAGGNDIYYVGATGDRVLETSAGGTDRVITNVSHTLAAHVEHLTATGLGALILAGNTLGNAITGNSRANKIYGKAGNDVLTGANGRDTLRGDAGNDKLYGGAGNDILYGGSGRDIFVVNTKLSSTANLDRIKDFSVRNDTFWLDNKYMPKLGSGSPAAPGKLKKAYFTVGDKAKDRNDYLIYNKETGVLLYDKDGFGSGRAVKIAILEKDLGLKYNDFYVI